MGDLAIPNAKKPSLRVKRRPLEHAVAPGDIGFPASLPLEIALEVDTVPNICAAYGVTRAQFEMLIRHPVFIKAYQEAVEMLKVEGMSFKMKARLQAEALLGESYKLAISPGTSDAVRADLIKSTVRWAGYETKAADGGGQGTAFNIMINL